jgi:hypothetical protein
MLAYVERFAGRTFYHLVRSLPLRPRLIRAFWQQAQLAF